MIRAILIILAIIGAALTALTVAACCVVAADADEQMEREKHDSN